MLRSGQPTSVPSLSIWDLMDLSLQASLEQDSMIQGTYFPIMPRTCAPGRSQEPFLYGLVLEPGPFGIVLV